MTMPCRRPPVRRLRAAALMLALLLLAAALPPAPATETENLGIRILPAPGRMTIDGKLDDWDLSGGIFACGDVENLRGRIAMWLHLMYDTDNLYILGRWTDETPMNNPGSVAGDHGFAGDCLQLRTLISTGEPDFRSRPEVKTQRTTHITAWRDRDGKDVIDLAWGIHFDQGGMKDARDQGGRQAFVRNADGKGYVQEIAVPWKLLAPEGWAPAAGARIIVTVEPNFGTETKFRISLKDLFRPGSTPDRVFTFASSPCWGPAVLAAEGRVQPQRLRLADAREFGVGMKDGMPVVDWTGLYEEKKMEGFAAIAFEMPDDGYVSLNIRNARGQVVRQLLTADFQTKGPHETFWDGLTNMSHRMPGEPVPAGEYSWEAIWHKGIGLRLVGWAHNAGRAPFDSPGGNWGGDMGNPCTVATDGQSMILGWSGSEAGKAVVCTDLDGNVRWRHKRGGFGMALLVAADGGVVFVYDRQTGDNLLYRLDAGRGQYAAWKGSADATLDVAALLASAGAAPKGGPAAPGLAGMDAAAGRLWLSCRAADAVLVLDAATGKVEKTVKVEAPGDLEVGADGRCRVLSAGTRLLSIDPATGAPQPVLDQLANATALALDPQGNLYIGTGDPDSQVTVYAPDGRVLRTIGRKGGRPLLGRWDPSGMRAIAGLRIDSKGRLWVMEDDAMPRRISIWDAASGAFVKELFGPTNYGAGGGAIDPLDPLTLVGQGCEWRLDPATGRASCVAVIHRGRWNNARFGIGPDNRLYLAIGGGWPEAWPVTLYERVAPGEWKLRSRLLALSADPKSNQGEAVAPNRIAGLIVWADANGDGQEQPDERKEYRINLGGWIDGWYMPMTQSLTFYGGLYRLAPVGWTACGAPVYDPTKSAKLPGPPDVGQRGGMGAQRDCGSEDGRLVLYNGHYGAGHSDFQCWDVETGALRWTYPNNYVGVHGGHHAPPPATGLIRAAYDIVGTGRLPDPIGDIFVIATDKGEWHVLTGDGYYLTALFQADPLKIRFPDPAVPGAIMDNVPPGMGAEDFGGSIAVTRDGQLYVQAGKTAFINMKVVGLDSVKRLGGGKLAVKAEDLDKARAFREKLLQASVGTRQTAARRRTVAFSGDLRKDFDTREPLAFQKTNADRVETAIAYDDANLYLGWQVSDATPWVNGATEPAVMYASGDTVDFQIGTDPKADRNRDRPAPGDLRLSIGNFQGKPTAVVYRPLASDKAPRKFYSGTVKEGYEMQSVRVLTDARIEVRVDPRGKGYTVEAAIPLATLGLKAVPGLTCRADIGATFGDPDGKDTVLRSYWNNQHTGLVADEVWELVLEPKHWGELVFE